MFRSASRAAAGRVVRFAGRSRTAQQQQHAVMLGRFSSSSTSPLATTNANSTAPPVDTRVNGKPVVVISGASSGIGEALSMQYAKQGVNLVLSARRMEKLQDVAQRCKDAGAAAVEVVECDVSKEQQCASLVERSVQLFGRMDSLVLNAGVGQSFFLEAMNPGVDIHPFMDINYYGCVYPTIAALPHLQRTDGRIVVVSSLGGLVPFPRQTLYNASKYALNGFYDSLRLELMSKRSGVSVTIVCPGFVKTEITSGAGLGRDGKPMGPPPPGKASALPVKMITATECAQDVVAAATKRQPLVITPKWVSVVFHLRKIFPGFVDWVLVKMFAPAPRKKK